MRPKLLVLASLVPLVLAAAPVTAAAQRRAFDRCRDGAGCTFDSDIARRARERAFELRAEARLRQLDAADRAREHTLRARLRSDEMRDRARIRADEVRARARERRYDRPNRYRVRW